MRVRECVCVSCVRTVNGLCLTCLPSANRLVQTEICRPKLARRERSRISLRNCLPRTPLHTVNKKRIQTTMSQQLLPKRLYLQVKENTFDKFSSAFFCLALCLSMQDPNICFRSKPLLENDRLALSSLSPPSYTTQATVRLPKETTIVSQHLLRAPLRTERCRGLQGDGETEQETAT